MITPLDIRKLEFNKKLRGYDIEEVRTSLESIAKDLEDLIKENTRLSEKVKVTEERLNHFKLMEKTLQDSVITMQNTLEEKRKAAEQEAGLIIQEAKHKASAEIGDNTDRIKKLKDEISALETQKSKYFIRFRNFLIGQLDWLDTMEKTNNDEQNMEHTDFRNARARRGRGLDSRTEISDTASG
jgi:cell division initiation protein